MKSDENKSNNGEEKEKPTEPTTNDIRSRLRKNPNKTKPLYTDDYNEKKTKKKKSNGFPPNDKDLCRLILDRLKKDDKSVLFRQPAVRSFEKKEDREYYKEKIKEPRDLGNITKKLKSEKYSIKDLYDDLELCWSNAQEFNEDDTEAYANAGYMRDLSHKIFAEYNLMDIVNKPKNNNTSNNNSTTKSVNNDFSNLTTDNNANVNKASLTTKKRKRNEEEEDEEYNKKRNKPNKSKKNCNSSEIPTFKDLKNKIKYPCPIISSPDEIPQLLKKKKINGKKNSKKDNLFSIEHNNHHSSGNHFNHRANKYSREKDLKSEDEKIQKENFRIISFEWKELPKVKKSNSYPKKSDKFFIQKTEENNKNTNETKGEDIPNKNNDKDNVKTTDKANDDIKNIGKQDTNDNNNSISPDEQKTIEIEVSKYIEEENIEMGKYDKNFNSENVYDMKAINEQKEKIKTEIQKQKQSLNNKNEYNNKRSNGLSNQKQHSNNQINNINNNNNLKDYSFKENKKINEKEDENIHLRHLIAKHLDKLTDNNMIDLLVFLENIRPQSIKEMPNDTIYIDMELFTSETYTKVLEFVKSFPR